VNRTTLEASDSAFFVRRRPSDAGDEMPRNDRGRVGVDPPCVETTDRFEAPSTRPEAAYDAA
jgi:hypothetical protein